MIRRKHHKLVVLSFCDGIGCAFQTFKELGYKEDEVLYIASEIDKDAIKVAKDNHPSICHLGDMRNVVYKNNQLFYVNFNWKDIDKKLEGIKKKLSKKDYSVVEQRILKKALLDWSLSGREKIYNGKIDLVCAGTPCTDVSLAGKKEGIFGNTKSALFWQFKRAVDEVEPTYWFLENVKMHSKWEDAISEALNKSPIRLNSAYWSAQNRERLYWTNITDKIDLKLGNDPLLKDILQVDVEHKWIDTSNKYFNNEPTFDINGCAQRARYWGKNKTRQVIEFRKDQKANCLTTVAKNSYVYTNGKVRDFSIAERERLQCLPDGYCKAISISKAVKALGNAWTVGVIKEFFKKIKYELEISKSAAVDS